MRVSLGRLRGARKQTTQFQRRGLNNTYIGSRREVSWQAMMKAPFRVSRTSATDVRGTYPEVRNLRRDPLHQKWGVGRWYARHARRVLRREDVVTPGVT